jgi:putative transcriptional regulator
MSSLQGHFLVAAPHQLDPNFAETVILVVTHSERGALGLIVNRPQPRGGRPLWQRNFRRRDPGKGLLYFGGPVTGPLMAVHATPALADVKILPGVFFAGSKRRVLAVLRGRTRPLKLFAGYVGWGAGQLEHETDIGVWRVLPATPPQIFSPSDDLWQELSIQASRLQLQALFHIHYVPADPRLN